MEHDVHTRQQDICGRTDYITHDHIEFLQLINTKMEVIFNKRLQYVVDCELTTTVHKLMFLIDLKCTATDRLAHRTMAQLTEPVFEVKN